MCPPARPGPPLPVAPRPTDDRIGDGDFEPHSVADLQARVWQLHDADHGAHVTLHRQRCVLQLCKAHLSGGLQGHTEPLTAAPAALPGPSGQAEQPRKGNEVGSSQGQCWAYASAPATHGRAWGPNQGADPPEEPQAR